MSLFGKIKKIFSFDSKKVSQHLIEDLEEDLINADVSFSIIKRLTNNLKTDDEGALAEIKLRLFNILKPKERLLAAGPSKPYVIFVSGVNGAGKTTTIAKLGNKFVLQGKKVLFGACDTFRAAACEQLEFWAKKTGCAIEKPLKPTEDPSAVAFRSLKRAREEEFDVLIIDTSGRLGSNKALMYELGKINKTLKDIDGTKPDLSLLVLDGAAGQTVISQVKDYTSFIKVDGVILTKMDSSAKGGTILGVAGETDLNIYCITLGEKLDDIADFKTEEFIENIFK